MTRYYFHLRDGETILDNEGTELADDDAARDHAIGVARELTFQSSGILHQDWSDWVMSVRDGDGVELFSFVVSDFEDRVEKIRRRS